jgi:hypothetical protein
MNVVSSDMDKQRKNIYITVFLLVLLAMGFFFGFIALISMS